MQRNMNIPLSDRIKRSVKEWTIDYLIIILLLVAVAIIFSIIYFLMGRIPEVTELQSNVLAFSLVLSRSSFCSVIWIIMAEVMVRKEQVLNLFLKIEPSLKHSYVILLNSFPGN